MSNEKNKDTLVWPLLWIRMIIQGQLAVKSGKLGNAPRIRRSLNIGLVTAVVATPAIFYFAQYLSIEGRIVFPLAAWLIGMAVQRFNYNRLMDVVELALTFVQALLFGLFWGPLIALSLFWLGYASNLPFP